MNVQDKMETPSSPTDLCKPYAVVAELPYPDHNYGQKQPVRQQTSPQASDTGVTRCICGMEHDDGYMICCDKCGVWQHLLCMGIHSDDIPELYFCEQCHPRPVDAERAKVAQLKKLEEMKDPYLVAKQKWRNYYRKKYELTDESKYDQNLLETPIFYRNSISKDSLKFLDEVTIAASIGKHMKALFANRDILQEQIVIVYQGHYYSEKKFKEANSELIGACPFILTYALDESENDISIDLRKYSNKARFIRRSCRPNCELYPMVIDNQIHICAYATQPIKDKTEITIPFDFDFSHCLYVDCACDTNQCKIRETLRSKSQDVIISPDRPIPKRAQTSIDEDTSDMYQIKRKKRTSVESESTDDVEITVDVDGISSADSSAVPCKPKKLSREEMKIAAIVQAFERMEKGEKRKRRESKGNEAGQSGNDDEEVSIKLKRSKGACAFRSRSHSRTNATSDMSDATSTTSTAPTSPTESAPFLYDDIYAVALTETKQNLVDCGISVDTEIPPRKRLLLEYQEVTKGKDNKENGDNIINVMKDLSDGYGCYKKRWILTRKLEDYLNSSSKLADCSNQSDTYNRSPDTFPIIKRRVDYKPPQTKKIDPLPFRKRPYYRNLKIPPKIELTAATPSTATPSQTSSSGRRKVSLLEYRNRRINADSRRVSEAGSNSSTPISTPTTSFNSPFFKQTGSPFEPVSPVGSPSVGGTSGISFKLPQGHSRNLSVGGNKSNARSFSSPLT
ncbi:SET domain-containing protein 5 [Trichoplax sp. H2]|nr:SET domain-containing protein 5 [Trichoplax sp. H2]|eukprot:RDD37703.1 SET domain-containing protein 5 [Trichoplax sp. H2]